MTSAQKPVELILARNLLSCLSTPAFLVDGDAILVFYNDAAAALLGRRFEETGRMDADAWRTQFGPFGPDGEPLPLDELPLSIALRHGHPAHHRFHIRSADGTDHEIEASATPLVSAEGSRGAMVIFWPVNEGADEIAGGGR
jgi:PAS domain-containing protein